MSDLKSLIAPLEDGDRYVFRLNHSRVRPAPDKPNPSPPAARPPTRHITYTFFSGTGLLRQALHREPRHEHQPRRPPQPGHLHRQADQDGQVPPAHHRPAHHRLGRPPQDLDQGERRPAVSVRVEWCVLSCLGFVGLVVEGRMLTGVTHSGQGARRPLVRGLPRASGLRGLQHGRYPARVWCGKSPWFLEVVRAQHRRHLTPNQTARSTNEARRLDPTGIVCFRQSDCGEYLRDEDTLFAS